MRKEVSGVLPSGPTGEIQQTVIQKQILPPPTEPPAPAKKREPPKETFSEWFFKLDPDERVNQYLYYLERLDQHLEIVDPYFDDRSRGGFLHKFSPVEISAFAQGDFEFELRDFVRKTYGGSKYSLKATNKKTPQIGSKTYRFEVEGQPVMSSRERSANGMAALGNNADGQLLPMIMKMIDEKLAAVSQQRQDPNTALAEVTKALNEAHSVAFKWAMDNAPKPDNPTERMKELREMLGVFNDLQRKDAAPAPPPASPTQQITEFAGMIRAVRDLDAPREQPANIKDLVREAVVAAVREAGGSRGRPGTDWGAIAEKALPILAPLGMALVARIKAPPAAVQPVIQPGAPLFPQFQRQPPNAGFTPTFPNQPASVGAPPGQPVMPHANVGPMPAAPPAPAQQVEITPDVQGAVLFDYMAHQLVQMVTDGETTGDVAAASIDKLFPDMADQLSAMNEQALTWYISSNPILSKVKDHPRLPQFVKDFVGYFRQVDDAPEIKPEPVKAN